MNNFAVALALLAGGFAVAQGSRPAPLQSWNLENCRAGGAVQAAVRAGQPHTCELRVTTVREGPAPVSATFRYQLEYQEGGQTRRIAVESADVWRAGTAGTIRLAHSGRTMTFSLPVSVRRRDDRAYTALTVSAELVFADGSRQRVYDTVPVR